MRLRSAVGLIPLIAVEVLEQSIVEKLPGFQKRLRWFLEHRADLAGHMTWFDRDAEGADAGGKRLLAIPTRERLERVLRVVLDERELLSPFGLRSLSRTYEANPYTFAVDGGTYRVEYAPGAGTSELFGGNSNWRGPVWFPINYLVIEALERWHHFYGDALRVECPVGSGRTMNLLEVAQELSRRLASLFLAGADGRRPFANGDPHLDADDAWRSLTLFHEYFHGDSGAGCGASHQTGWTALVTRCLEKSAWARGGA
jgi:hypothetical protein